MVLSVVAIGGVAFADSAAASPGNDANFDGFVAANPADTGGGVTSASHVVTINVTQSNLNGNNLGQVTLNYTDAVNLNGLTGDGSDVEVSVVSQSGDSVTSTGGTTEGVTINTNGDSNSEVVIDTSSTNPTVNEGDLVRVHLSDSVDHTSLSDGTVTVETSITATNTQSKNLDLELPGPIEYDGGSSTHYSLQAALSQVSGSETVEVKSFDSFNFDELDELFTQPTNLGGSTTGLNGQAVSNSGAEIKGNNETIYYTGTGEAVIQLQNDVTVENVSLNGSGFLNENEVAINSNDAAGGLAINNSSIQDYGGSSPAINIGNEDGFIVQNNNITTAGHKAIDIDNLGSGNDGTISDNTVDGVSGSDAIDVNNIGGSDSLDVVGNDVTKTGTAAGIAITPDGANPTLTINDTIINGEASASDTGILIDVGGDITGNAFSGTIGGDGTDISGANTSISVEFGDATMDGQDDTVAINSAALTLAGDGTSVTAIDVPGTLGDSLILNVSETTISGDSDVTGIDANDGKLVVNLDTGVDDGSAFSGVGTGVNLQSTSSTGDISNTTFTDIGSAAISAADTGDGLVIENITVDGTASDSASAVSFSDGSNSLTVRNSQFGAASDEEVQDGVDVTSAGGDIAVNNTTIRVDGGNAISETATNTNELIVDGVTINGSDQSGTGINVNDGSLTVTIDPDTNSTIQSVDTGVDLQATSSTSDISGTTFTNIGSAAISAADTGDGLVLDNITVDGSSSSATAVSFSDGSNGLTVTQSNFGTSSNAVQNGVSVTNAGGNVDVSNTTVLVDTGVAIEDDNAGNANSLTIDSVTVDGSDGTGTGIDINDGSLTGLSIDPNAPSTIQNIDTGINIQKANGKSVTLDQTSITDFESTGISQQDSGAVTLSGVTLTEADDAGATGLDAAGTPNVTINSQTTIEVADNSDSTGVLVDIGGSSALDITKSTIAAKDTQSDGTAIDLDSVDETSVSIKLNNIEGFNTSSGLGLDATDEGDSLQDDDVEGNYWGSEYGPDADAGSNISSGVAAEVYDPFLTADLSTQVNNAEDADSVSGLTESDVQEFAHGLTVGEGESFAFPATSTDTQLSDLYVDNSSNVAIYEYNATSQSWELASGRPTGLDAYVASFGDDGDSMNVKIEYESQSSGVDRGTYEYQDGFNYLPVAQENTGVTSSVIGATDGFDLTDPPNTDTRFASQYTGAANDIYSQTSYATVSGDNLGTPSPDMSPFQGTFVNIETTSVDDNQIAPLDPSVSLANADDIDE